MDLGCVSVHKRQNTKSASKARHTWSVTDILSCHDYGAYKTHVLSQQSQLTIGHFTVVYSVTWPMNANEAFSFKCKLVGKNWFTQQSREVCIKTRSNSASLPFRGQVTGQTTENDPSPNSLPVDKQMPFFYCHDYHTLTKSLTWLSSSGPFRPQCTYKE